MLGIFDVQDRIIMVKRRQEHSMERSSLAEIAVKAKHGIQDLVPPTIRPERHRSSMVRNGLDWC